MSTRWKEEKNCLGSQNVLKKFLVKITEREKQKIWNKKYIYKQNAKKCIWIIRKKAQRKLHEININAEVLENSNAVFLCLSLQ